MSQCSLVIPVFACEYTKKTKSLNRCRKIFDNFVCQIQTQPSFDVRLEQKYILYG